MTTNASSMSLSTQPHQLPSPYNSSMSTDIPSLCLSFGHPPYYSSTPSNLLAPVLNPALFPTLSQHTFNDDRVGSIVGSSCHDDCTCAYEHLGRGRLSDDGDEGSSSTSPSSAGSGVQSPSRNHYSPQSRSENVDGRRSSSSADLRSQTTPSADEERTRTRKRKLSRDDDVGPRPLIAMSNEAARCSSSSSLSPSPTFSGVAVNRMRSGEANSSGREDSPRSRVISPYLNPMTLIFSHPSLWMT